jgi:hypothetical protein
MAQRDRSVSSRLGVRVVERREQDIYRAVIVLQASDRSDDARTERRPRLLQARVQRNERRRSDAEDGPLDCLGYTVVDEQIHQSIDVAFRRGEARVANAL